MRIILIIYLVVGFLNVFAQEKLVKEALPDLEWGEGSILLNDGKQITGMIRFNDRSGLVSYESGSDNRSFSARSIQAFEFFDEQLGRQRVFYSIEYADRDDALKRPMLFEVLKDFTDFAVLSKLDPLEFKQKISNGPVGVNGIGISRKDVTTKITFTETVYVLTPTGEVKPYMKVDRKVVDRQFLGNVFDTDDVQSKVLDGNVFRDLFPEPEYTKMIQFAAKHYLLMDNKEHLIKILDYYADVIRNGN